MDNTKDTPMDYKQFEGENLLVKMTAVLNSLAREYDRIDLPNSIKHLIDKGYNLSLEGHQHLSLLDNLTEENTSLKLELQKQKELNAELVKVSNNNKCELLDRYTEFLKKEGYIDTDATMEHPTAIDIFLKKDRANESLIKKSSEI